MYIYTYTYIYILINNLFFLSYRISKEDIMEKMRMTQKKYRITYKSLVSILEDKVSASLVIQSILVYVSHKHGAVILNFKYERCI